MKFNIAMILLILSIFSGLACSTGTYINIKPKKLSQRPKNIIFAQIDGLGITHMGALRFAIQNNQEVDYLGSFTCSGITWHQNFTKMRPTSFNAMNAQIIGSKSISGTCEDFGLMPFWQRFVSKNKKVVLLEIGASSNNTLAGKKSCQGDSFMSGVTHLRMRPKISKGEKTFNYREQFPVLPGIFYDENCSGSKNSYACRSNSFENIRFVGESLFKKNKNTIFVIRDFNYKKLIEAKKFREAFKYLHNLLRAILILDSKPQSPANLLTLIGGVNSKEIEFPNTQKGWNRLMRTNQGKIFQYDGLQSLVLSKGASGENYCGSFFDSEMVSRIFFHMEREYDLSEIIQGLIEW